jgi:hypothetical protein
MSRVEVREGELPAVVLTSGTVVECARLWVAEQSGWVGAVTRAEPDRITRWPPTVVQRVVEDPVDRGVRGRRK